MFWIFMAVLFLVMGGAFLAGGSMDPLIGGTFTGLGGLFILIGGVFLVVAVWSIRSSGRRKQIARSGIAGTATVTGMSDTGASVNDAPLVAFQFLVSVPGRPPYPVSKHLVLPRLQVGRVAPGAMLPVKVDPNDPNELLLEWDSEWDAASGPLMGGAYGVPGSFGQAGFGQSSGSVLPAGWMPPPGWVPPLGSTPPPGWGTPGQTVASFGVPPMMTTSMSSTVIDATGGHDPIAMVSADQLDQATLDRINRVLYDREHGTGPVAPGAAPSPASSATRWAQPPAIDQVIDAIGRGTAGTSAGTSAGMSPGSSVRSSVGGGASSGSTVTGSTATGGTTAGFGLLDPKQAERLAAVGYTGRATIEAFQDTGIATGDEHLYTMQLTVRVEGRRDEQVRHAALVPQRALSRLTTGATLPVRVDPLDASQVIVEWDKG